MTMFFTKSIRVLLALGIVVSLGACDLFEKRNRAFDDDPKVEFFPTSQVADEGAGAVTFEVQLIGPQRDSELPVTFTVADSSTAVQGTHYELGSTSATIPSNSSQTEVTLTVLDDNQDNGGSNFQLFLNLQGTDGVEAAENLDAYTLTIRGADE